MPDALNPFKLTDFEDPEETSFLLDGRFVLKEKDRGSKGGPVIDVVKVFEEGWYQRAIFSSSHTAIRNKT